MAQSPGCQRLGGLKSGWSLYGKKIIDKWLVPHQATSSVDHVAEIRRVIRRLVQATDKSAAVQAWSTETVRFSRLSQSGIIPLFWLQEIQKAMTADDWLQAKTTLETLLEPPQSRTPANKRPRVPNQAAAYNSGDALGLGFISTIHRHRPHCTGLRWKRAGTPADRHPCPCQCRRQNLLLPSS